MENIWYFINIDAGVKSNGTNKLKKKKTAICWFVACKVPKFSIGNWYINQYYEYIMIDMIVKEYRVDFEKPLKASYLQRFGFKKKGFSAKKFF